jgi:hypothetical protein
MHRSLIMLVNKRDFNSDCLYEREIVIVILCVLFIFFYICLLENEIDVIIYMNE